MLNIGKRSIRTQTRHLEAIRSLKKTKTRRGIGQQIDAVEKHFPGATHSDGILLFKSYDVVGAGLSIPHIGIEKVVGSGRLTESHGQQIAKRAIIQVRSSKCDRTVTEFNQT